MRSVWRITSAPTISSFSTYLRLQALEDQVRHLVAAQVGNLGGLHLVAELAQHVGAPACRCPRCPGASHWSSAGRRIDRRCRAPSPSPALSDRCLRATGGACHRRPGAACSSRRRIREGAWRASKFCISTASCAFRMRLVIILLSMAHPLHAQAQHEVLHALAAEDAQQIVLPARGRSASCRGRPGGRNVRGAGYRCAGFVALGGHDVEPA